MTLPDVGAEPPEIHHSDLKGFGRGVVDEPMELGNLVQDFVDPLAGLSPGHGGGEARPCLVESVKLEQASFETAF